jgi:nucleoside-diphosphate-sugar epimerase
MRVLVTGGAGYIGCWAVKKLLDSGATPVVLVKCFFPAGVKYVQSLGVPIIEADIRDYKLSEAPEFDAIIHLAV